MAQYNIEDTIALDLGTTNSVCALFHNGNIVLLDDENGKYLFPSVMSLSKDGGFDIGAVAATKKGKPDTAYEMKRLLGRKSDDPVVVECKRTCKYKIVDNEKNLPVALLTGNKGDVSLKFFLLIFF